MENVIGLVTQILEMDKQLEEYKNKVILLQNEKLSRKCTCNERSASSSLSNVERKFIDYAKDKIFKDIFYWDQDVRAQRKNEEVVYTDFNEWVDGLARQNNRYIPKTLSQVEIIDFFRSELMDKYEEECKKAYDRLLEREKKEAEEEREEDE